MTTPRIIIQGSMPIKLFAKIADAFSKQYPGSVSLVSSHPLCIQHGAVTIIVAPGDAALKKEIE